MKIVRAAWNVWPSLLLLLIGSLMLADSALAQSPQETALARTLFEEGVTLADRGDWVSAADRFSRAYSLKPTPGIAFNLAKAQQETGHFLHAQELLRTVIRDPTADPELKQESQTLLRSLEARSARLRIVTKAKPRADTEIEVDGASWPRAAWGYASPIDPGKHTVVCKEDGAEVARADVELREGETRDLTLSGDAADERNDSANGSGAGHGKPLYKNWMVWTAVGAVVAGGVITTVLLTRSDGDGQSSPVMGNTTPGVIRW
jgi:hypothetical protein